MNARKSKAQAEEIFKNFKQHYETASWIEVNNLDFDRELMAPVLQIIDQLEKKQQ